MMMMTMTMTMMMMMMMPGNRIDVGGGQFVRLVTIGSHPWGSVFSEKPDDVGTLVCSEKAASDRCEGGSE